MIKYYSKWNRYYIMLVDRKNKKYDLFTCIWNIKNYFWKDFENVYRISKKKIDDLELIWIKKWFTKCRLA